MAGSPKYLNLDKKEKSPKDKWELLRPVSRKWECENCKFAVYRDPHIETLDFVCPGCGGKFIRTETVERATIDPDKEYGWIEFLKTRQGDGITQSWQVRFILLKKENDYEGGWVPLTLIEKCAKSKYSIGHTRLIRLLDDMEKYQVVFKKKGIAIGGPNKNRTFYQYNGLVDYRTLTKEGIRKEHARLLAENFDLIGKFYFAQRVLKRHGLLQEYLDDLKKWNNGGEKKD
jgi:hypothetical protein